MKQAATLSVVPTTNTVDNAPLLSPARAALAQAIAARTGTDADFQDAVKQHQRVEKLIPDKTAIRNRIAELEQIQSAAIERWAIEGETVEPPLLPAVAEIGHLRSELKAAEAVEPGARAAAARMLEQIAACQQDSRRAIERVQDAGAAVIFEEAEAEAAELERLEQRVAELRGSLVARSRHLLFESRRRPSGGDRSAAVARLVARPLELAPDVVNQKVRSLQDFAERLVTNPHAQLEG